MAHCKDKFLVQTEVLQAGEVRSGHSPEDGLAWLAGPAGGR
jgi:hypothetical protein